MATSCAPLVLRSNFSLLTGTVSIEDVVEWAQRQELPYLALTDRNNLYGAIPFYKRCREAGIKPIIGVEIADNTGHAVLLARNLDGYANLCKIITRKNLAEDFSLAACIAECREGLYILTEDLDLADRLVGRVDKRYLYLLLATPGRSPRHREALEEKSRKLDLNIVVSHDAYFLRRDDYELHKVLRAVEYKTTVSRLKCEDLAHPESCFMTVGEASKIFGEKMVGRAHPTKTLMHDAKCKYQNAKWEEAMEQAARIADDCNLELPLGKPIFPKVQLPDGQSPRGFLADLCRQGLTRRYNPVPPQAEERLRRELRVIDELGFTDYFLFVWDIMEFARHKGMRTTGRGSGASSIVSYLLGITQADPIRYGLAFERFLHKRRADCPDLDVDVCWIKRDELIDSIYKKYGEDRVAMVSIHCTLRLRSAFREVAKACGVPNDIVNQVSGRLPHDSPSTAADMLAQTGADRLLPLPPGQIARIAELTEQIRNAPRHLGIHCGGLVIGDKPLENYVPLERAAKGIRITQYEKDAIEDIGLVKMDILGNHGLTVQDESFRLIRDRGLSPPDLDNIPDTDPAAIELLREARTISCCQLESPAMRNLLRMLQVSSVKDVMQALALIRPAPASCGMKEHFVRRARGLESWSAPHPSLRGVLDDTYGIMLYEDDAMMVASAMAGTPLEEGDLLRRAIAKSRTKEKLLEISRRFLSQAVAHGTPLESAAEMWFQMAKFNSYSFCRAHAASYAIMAYQLAYLKAHHPLEFMTAALNHQWGMYPKRVHLEEAKRLGLDVRGPCVNRSEGGFTIDDGAIRVGLGQVRELSTAAIRSILAARNESHFDSLGDFWIRVQAAESEVENLILCGAFDFTGRIRPELIAELKLRSAMPRRRDLSRSLVREIAPPLKLPRLKDYALAQKLAYEYSILELILGDHPMKSLRGELQRQGLIDSRQLPDRVGKSVRIAGVLSARRPTATKTGQAMEFLTLEDEKGVFEATLFPKNYRNCARDVDGYGPYVVEGTVEDQYGAILLNTRSISLPIFEVPE